MIFLARQTRNIMKRFGVYESQGRFWIDWELIKLHPLDGNPTLGLSTY